MRLTRTRGKRVPGFTLVEMAIVLVIIGIILAGIMKGRDIVRGSQVKQFSQGFAQKWVTIAATYYDKVGQHLADGADNGGAGINPTDGRMDNITFLNSGVGPGLRGPLLDALQNVGITPCTMIKTDLEDDAATGTRCANNYNIYERTVEGETTGKSRVTMGLACLQISGWAIRNAVSYTNVPVDVAIGLDTLIDGQADGENGSCLCLGQTDKTALFTDPLTFSGLTAATPIPYPSEASGDHFLWIALILDY